MKILHIAAGLGFGGVAEVAAMLALHQQRLGCSVTVATVAAPADELSSSVGNAVKAGVKLVRFAPACPRAIYFSREMLAGLDALVQAADVVHVHSNWTFPVWHSCRLALKHKKTLVMTPHGCLVPERLAHSRWKKRLVGGFDRYYLKRASTIHATCAAEAEDIKAFISSAGVCECASVRVDPPSGAELCRVGQTNELINSRTNALPPVVVVPNGIELDEFDGEMDLDFWKKRYPEIGDKKIILAMGRLHPLKGLDILISAWAIVVARSNKLPMASVQPSPLASPDPTIAMSNWMLVIAGPDEQGTQAQLKALVDELGLEENVIFVGAISASERKDALGSAQYLVLPSRHENFGLTVAEALACRVPVIASKGAPWAELHGCSESAGVRARARAQVLDAAEPLVQRSFNEGTPIEESSSLIPHPSPLMASGRCGWWVDVGVEPLAAALKEAFALSLAERRKMGENGRRLVEERYQWGAIAEQVLEVYAGGGVVRL